jgi:DNA-binding beta-propeller fold protein YncE
MRHPLPSLFALALCTAAPALAQGDFINFETPQVKPIAVARISGHDYLLVCNTPADSVEIYDTSTNAFVTEFRTGLRPVTVRFNPNKGQVLTANFIGDSVTIADLIPQPTGGLKALVRRTSYVGDEPCDIDFLPGFDALVVTLNSRNAMALIDGRTLAPIGGTLGARFLLTSPLLSAAPGKALKEPRRIRFLGTTMVAMGYKGGNTPTFDYDILTFDLLTRLQTEVGGLGSHNENFAWGPDNKLYVVGTMARNDVVGATALKNLPTGFAESRLWVVSNLGLPGTSSASRDLNRDSSGTPVLPTKAVARPTDIALMTAGNQVEKVFVTGFHSDRVIVLHPDTNPPDQWPASHIDLPNGANPDYARSGPRGLVFKPANPAQTEDPGPRVYVLNRLSNSISVLDPVLEQELARLPLRRDPTPVDIRKGREFLYSADLSNGFNSCATCHLDGNSDGVLWRLSDPGDPDVPIDPAMLDGVIGPQPTNFPGNKGPIVTQTLHGVADYLVNKEAQHLFDNRPYHWRGDNLTLEFFNGAFTALQGAAAPLNPGQLAQLVRTMQTISHAPNPEQLPDRRYPGILGDPDLEDGRGALRGLKLFHTRELPGGGPAGRSCVQCHFLPECSNNRITQTVDTNPAGSQPFESAAMRMMFERESRLEIAPWTLSSIVTGEAGLSHDGGINSLVNSVNWFNFRSFSIVFTNDLDKLVDITEFSRTIDSGIAPLVGAAHTVDAATRNSPETQVFLNLAENQALETNSGLAVYRRVNGVEAGYWFDASVTPPVYREVVTNQGQSRAQLLAALTGANDVLVAQAVPLGAERRFAAIDSNPPLPTGPAPANLSLEPMVASTQWEAVPSLTKNWVPGTGPLDFNWLGGSVATPPSLKTIRIFQLALISKAPSGFGLPRPRHEAPRRFAVAGNNIRPGAVLRLEVPADVTPPPYSGSEATLPIEVEVYPTNRLTGDGRRIWESAVEADPTVVYMLMLGGPFAPDVQAARDGLISEPPLPGDFDPVAWNLHRVTVRNADGTSGSPALPWQRVLIQ